MQPVDAAYKIFQQLAAEIGEYVNSLAPFSEWDQTFTDPRLAAAIVDRLTFNAHIIQTGTDSYRLRSSRAASKEAAAR